MLAPALQPRSVPTAVEQYQEHVQQGLVSAVSVSILNFDNF